MLTTTRQNNGSEAVPLREQRLNDTGANWMKTSVRWRENVLCRWSIWTGTVCGLVLSSIILIKITLVTFTFCLAFRAGKTNSYHNQGRSLSSERKIIYKVRNKLKGRLRSKTYSAIQWQPQLRLSIRSVWFKTEPNRINRKPNCSFFFKPNRTELLF